MNFKQATTHVLMLSVIQRGAVQTHCLQHWGQNGKLLKEIILFCTIDIMPGPQNVPKSDF